MSRSFMHIRRKEDDMIDIVALFLGRKSGGIAYIRLDRCVDTVEDGLRYSYGGSQ